MEGIPRQPLRETAGGIGVAPASGICSHRRCTTSPAQHFHHVEHRPEQCQGQAARRNPQTGDLDTGRFAAACSFI